MDTNNTKTKGKNMFTHAEAISETHAIIKTIGLDYSIVDVDEIENIQDNLITGETDFDVVIDGAEYRIISTDCIDEIMQEELLNDKYVLGCCTPWFIADCTDLDIDAIERAQKNESFELLGELLAKDIKNVQEKMVSCDGYGNHFNHYDSNEYETSYFYIFRIG